MAGRRPLDLLANNDHYEMVKYINRGAYAEVLLARNKQNQQLYALKFIERGQEMATTDYAEREIVNHMKLRHPHVIALHEVFLTQDHLVLVLEFAAGGDLFSRVSRSQGLAEDDARWFFQQIVVAMDYCHKLGVCNRDIKLENTLLDGSAKPLVKLCDFGFSKDASYHSAPGSVVGTAAYLAPEVIAADQGATYDGPAADVWSCGVLLYIMACGAYPFRAPKHDALKPTRNQGELIKLIQAATFVFPDDASAKAISPECKDLVRRMLVADPAQRATLREVMQHPWYQVGLSPAVLSFNDALVAKSRAEPVTEETKEEIRRLVHDAARRAA